MELATLIEQAHSNAKEKGFWDKPRETGTLIALIHSEVTEALEAGSCAEFTEELADICLRIFDLMGSRKIVVELESIEGVVTWEKFLKFIEKNMKEEEINLDPLADETNHLGALSVHYHLSKTLESDRKDNKELFCKSLTDALILTVAWSIAKGYNLLPSILDKMEKNKLRPRMHGKKY